MNDCLSSPGLFYNNLTIPPDKASELRTRGSIAGLSIQQLRFSHSSQFTRVAV